jgi:hypothetical protein
MIRTEFQSKVQKRLPLKILYQRATHVNIDVSKIVTVILR